jgi:hypothetical protein
MAVVRQISESDRHKKQVAYVRCQFRRARIGHRLRPLRPRRKSALRPTRSCAGLSLEPLKATRARAPIGTDAQRQLQVLTMNSNGPFNARRLAHAKRHGILQGRESEILPGRPNLTTLSRPEPLRGSGESTLQTLTTHPPRGCARAAGHRQRDRPSGGVPARQLPLWTNTVASVAVRISFQVILVLWLRLPEIASGRKLGHHFARPQP